MPFLNEEKTIHLANTSYNEDFTKAMTLGKTIVEHDENLKSIIVDIWEKLKKIIKNI